MTFQHLARTYRDGQAVGEGYFAEIIRFDYENERVFILKPKEGGSTGFKVRTRENLTSVFPDGLKRFPVEYYPFVITDAEAEESTGAIVIAASGESPPEYSFGYIVSNSALLTNIGNATLNYLNSTNTVKRAVSLSAIQGVNSAIEAAKKTTNLEAFSNALKQTFRLK